VRRVDGKGLGFLADLCEGKNLMSAHPEGMTLRLQGAPPDGRLWHAASLFPDGAGTRRRGGALREILLDHTRCAPLSLLAASVLVGAKV
jgi:hypothetical protein